MLKFKVILLILLTALPATMLKAVHNPKQLAVNFIHRHYGPHKLTIKQIDNRLTSMLNQAFVISAHVETLSALPKEERAKLIQETQELDRKLIPIFDEIDTVESKINQCSTILKPSHIQEHLRTVSSQYLGQDTPHHVRNKALELQTMLKDLLSKLNYNDV